MKYLIVANGPFLYSKIILELAADKDCIIVALDGAADKLAKLGIKPHVILGDFDSLNKTRMNIWGIKKTFVDIDNKSEPYMGKYQVKIVPVKNQELNDLAKAIKYCDENNATQIDIVCATGGRQDHSEINKRLLSTYYNNNRPIWLHLNTQSLLFVKDQVININGEPEDYCGIFSYPKGEFTSQGLKYNGNHFPLEFAVSESSSNQLEAKTASISIKGDALIVLPPVLQAQREFLNKKYKEQLQILLQQEDAVLIETPYKEWAAWKKHSFTEANNPKLTEIHPVSHSEDAIYTHSLPNTEPILLSVSTKNYRDFCFFQKNKAQMPANKGMFISSQRIVK